MPEDAFDRDLSLDRGAAVASELYERQRRDSPQVGWKLGATDPAVQERLGAAGPFHAPIFGTTRLPEARAVSMRRFVAPLLEAEIAIEIAANGAAVRALPCVEIADCRFPSWDVRIAHAVADFGLHGAVLLGHARADAEEIEVRVSVDGTELARGRQSLGTSRHVVGTLAEALGDGLQLERTPATFVATGSVAPPVPLAPGRWKIEFRGLGDMSFDVVP